MGPDAEAVVECPPPVRELVHRCAVFSCRPWRANLAGRTVSVDRSAGTGVTPPPPGARHRAWVGGWLVRGRGVRRGRCSSVVRAVGLAWRWPSRRDPAVTRGRRTRVHCGSPRRWILASVPSKSRHVRDRCGLGPPGSVRSPDRSGPRHRFVGFRGRVVAGGSGDGVGGNGPRSRRGCPAAPWLQARVGLAEGDGERSGDAAAVGLGEDPAPGWWPARCRCAAAPPRLRRWPGATAAVTVAMALGMAAPMVPSALTRCSVMVAPTTEAEPMTRKSLPALYFAGADADGVGDRRRGERRRLR